MKRPENIPQFSKALLAGALTGLAAAILNIIYDIAFRGITHYLPAEEFNFFSITFASMILLTLTGMLLFLCIKYFSSATFIIVMSILIIVTICITSFFHLNPNEAAFYGNHGLIAGFILIRGVLSLTLMLYLYNHPKIFI